ncbi:MAG: histidine phosphatase family protein [Edaphobacter sp.]|nr:histidine phosphatase family protein [Edaphobacter sp.]
MKDSDIPGRITLLSHAPTLAVRKAIFPLDEPVDARELEKFESISWIRPRVHQVYAGPEQRAVQTAEALGFEPTHCEELKDLDCHAWRGKSLEKVQSADPEGVRRWLTDVDAAPHGGESIARLLERIEHWVAGQRSSGHTLAVTHPAVIRAAVILALQAPAQSFWRIDVSPLSITDFRWNGRFWSLRNSGCPLFRHEN